MKYSAATVFAIMALAKAQSVSVPGEDAVSSIIGDVSSRVESIASEVSSRAADASAGASSIAEEISSRVASLSSAATATGASETVT